MRTQNYNPDVLTCLANLSNDEVFTPPAVVNKMLDMLPAELWSNPDAKFLDPVSKTGVFLREIAKRLMEGLKEQIPDVQQRADHIFGKQLYGLAITELTALMSRRSVYCSKYANGRYSVCTAFDDEQGNIRYEPTAHTCQNGRCVYCGASQEVYDRGGELESHAYRFIHTDNPKKLYPNMKFDVIIGNPPYQLSDGGFGISASPIYDKFITNAKKLNPRYLTMIVPARWYAGGKGLDDFRDEMLHDTSIREIHDFPEANDCFSGVQIKGGVCYFLWDRDNKGDCKVVTHRGDKISDPMFRGLLEKGCDSFIRYNEAIGILNKVKRWQEPTMETIVSSRQPFGLPTTYHGDKQSALKNIKVYENRGISYCSEDEITKNKDMIPEYKVFISRAGSGSDSFPHPILGRPFVGEPYSVSSETYIFIGAFDSEQVCLNVISYIQTRFFRFLAMLRKVTQSTTRSVYTLIPQQNFSESWSDDKLYKKYGLSNDEIAFIASMIQPME